MTEIRYAAESVCPKCARMVRHKPQGGPLCWHGCRLRWIARKVALAERDGWREGYKFAVDHAEEPMVYADIAEYGTGWAGVIGRGGISPPASSEAAPHDR